MRSYITQISIVSLMWLCSSWCFAEDHFGQRLRKELDSAGLSVVDLHTGTDHKGGYYVEYVTCPKPSFSKLKPWDGTQKSPKSMESLVGIATKIAKQESKSFFFEGLMINPCEDDSSKRFVTIWFQEPKAPSYDDIMIHLLLDGSPTKTVRRELSSKEYDELGKDGISKAEQDVAPNP